MKIIMKKIYTFLFLLSQNILFAQSVVHEKISCVSMNKDTLWLINNFVGQQIAKSWKFYEDKPEEKKPMIILVDVLPPDPFIEKKKTKKNKHK